jgi:uncharacterized protein YuzE
LERLIRLYYLPELDTLDLWLDDPDSEALSEPLNDNVIVKLNNKNDTIGIEVISLSRLNEEDIESMPIEIREALISALKKIAAKTFKA